MCGLSVSLPYPVSFQHPSTEGKYYCLQLTVVAKGRKPYLPSELLIFRSKSLEDVNCFFFKAMTVKCDRKGTDRGQYVQQRAQARFGPRPLR